MVFLHRNIEWNKTQNRMEEGAALEKKEVFIQTVGFPF
jgi:hypothetical protein